MINARLFEGKEYPLTIYNGKAIINRAFRFFTVIDCPGEPYEEIPYDFPEYDSSYFRVFNERNGRELVEVALSQSDEYLIVNANASDMTFDENGKYYYEIGYVRDGYEQALRYGELRVV